MRWRRAKPATQQRAGISLAAPYISLPVLPLPGEAAAVYGEIRAALEPHGERIGGNDLWIAAHAKSARLTLVTNNEREFKRVFRGSKDPGTGSAAIRDVSKSVTEMQSGYNKGTIRSDIGYLVVSKDVRRHRLISSDYIKTLRCHGRGREFESRRPRHSFTKDLAGFWKFGAKRPRKTGRNPFLATTWPTVPDSHNGYPKTWEMFLPTRPLPIRLPTRLSVP